VSITLPHPEARIVVEESGPGRRRVTVQPFTARLPVLYPTCETSYPLALIEAILKAKGPTFLCDEILREESYSYVRSHLEYGTLGYLGEAAFEGKRILDFGCGSGSSTMILCKLFPRSQIVGVDYEARAIPPAELRAEHYGFQNVRFLVSPGPDRLPENLGTFDFIVFSAVFEHLLPRERPVLLLRLWSLLNSGGVLFIHELPHRYSPLESHTTGLPFINYLPAPLALPLARRFSRRLTGHESWEALLRAGIRGGTETEIVQILRQDAHSTPLVLQPGRLGLGDRIDLWYAISGASRPGVAGRTMKLLFKAIGRASGITFEPYLTLAIQKGEGPAGGVRSLLIHHNPA
jgi:2-polyprenyl-3-methyl-5-hydroxy-6-metoxy-1,4-benzoquinol methylase